MAFNTPYEMKVNTFTLFKNDRKTDPSHSDWKGSIKLADGQEYWFDAWEKQGKKGMYISGKVGQPKVPKGFTPRGHDELPKEDEVPF